MNFNKHLYLEGTHAPFGASKSSWLRYSDDKVVDVYKKRKAAEIGTRLHAWAKETIDLGIKQPRSKKTLYAYVNDAIGFKMSTEVVLYYSERFYGTADTISFRYESRNEKDTLRIHDYKSGENPVSMEQLEVYAALFCLEYHRKPEDICIELRLYQNDDVVCHIPEPEDINQIMNKIIHIDRLLEKVDHKEG